jgi:hypothetical protein
VITTGNVHVRTGPNKSTSSIGVLPPGTTITGLAVGGWVAIDYHGETGFVSMKITQPVPPKPDQPTDTPSLDPVCLAPRLLAPDALYIRSSVLITLKVVGDPTGTVTATIAGGPDDYTLLGRDIGTGDTLILPAFTASYWVRYFAPDFGPVADTTTLEIVDWQCV